MIPSNFWGYEGSLAIRTDHKPQIQSNCYQVEYSIYVFSGQLLGNSGTNCQMSGSKGVVEAIILTLVPGAQWYIIDPVYLFQLEWQRSMS